MIRSLVCVGVLATLLGATLSGCGGGDADQGGGSRDGSQARQAKQRVDGVVRDLLAALRDSAAGSGEPEVQGAGAFTPCGLGAAQHRYDAHASLMAPGSVGARVDDARTAALRAVLERRGFAVQERDGELVGHDDAGVALVVRAAVEPAQRPGTWLVALTGSSACVDYSDADLAVVRDTESEDYASAG